MGTALLVIDVQRALVEPPHGVVDAEGLVARLGRLLDRARSAGVPVIHVQDDGDADPSIERGTPGWELVLPVLDGDVVVAKTGDDAFDGTGLHALLTSRGVDTVVVVGIQSEMCVLSTARTAQSRGFGVVLPRGGHATYDVPARPARRTRGPGRPRRARGRVGAGGPGPAAGDRRAGLAPRAHVTI